MKQEKCNCQYEKGHSLACPLYKESKNPLESSDFTTKKMEEWIGDIDNYIDYRGEADKEDILPFIRRDLLKSYISQFLQQTRQEERQRIVEIISKMKKECLGNPEMMQNLEDRIYNETIYDIINLILQDNK